MIAANVLPKEEFPEFDEQTGILPKMDDDEGKALPLFSRFSVNAALQRDASSLTVRSTDEELEIDLVEEEPPFLRGQTKFSTNMSPVKIVKVFNTCQTIYE